MVCGALGRLSRWTLLVLLLTTSALADETAPAGPTGYLTDIEGKMSKIDSWAKQPDNPVLYRDAEGKLQLRDGARIVFGGDYIDRGPESMKVVEEILDLKSRAPDRVVTLMGNHELSYLWLQKELSPEAMAHISPGFEQWLMNNYKSLRSVGRSAMAKYNTQANRMKYFLSDVMGAPKEFEYRREHIKQARGGMGYVSDESVVKSVLDDLAPGGKLRELLNGGKIVHREGGALYVHGALTPENFGVVPGREGAPIEDVDEWIKQLNGWYHDRIEAWKPEGLDEVISYQAPERGKGGINPVSVIASRYSDKSGNPQLPDGEFMDKLRDKGIRFVIVGHTPQADTPTVLHDSGVHIVIADNGAAEHGTVLTVSPEGNSVEIDGVAKVKDAGAQRMHFKLNADEEPLLGKRLKGTQLIVKGRLQDGRWLLTEVLPEYKVKTVIMDQETVSKSAFELPRPTQSGRFGCIVRALLRR